MPKVTMTIEDADDSGGISFSVEFNPSISNDETVLSPAQAEAAFMIEVMQRRASGQTLDQIAEEMADDEYGSVAGGYEPSEVVYEAKDDENVD